MVDNVEQFSHVPELRATRMRSNAAMPSLLKSARCQSGLKEVDGDKDGVAAEERDIPLLFAISEDARQLVVI
jgi:hypothetical protein